MGDDFYFFELQVLPWSLPFAIQVRRRQKNLRSTKLLERRHEFELRRFVIAARCQGIKKVVQVPEKQTCRRSVPYRPKSAVQPRQN